MTAIAGLRGTGQFSTDFRPTNYRELFTLLEPNGTAPLQALLAMTDSEETDDPKYNHFRDELPDRVMKVNFGTGYNASATDIVVDASDNIKFVVPGTLITNLATGEVMRATAAGNSGTNTLSVARNIGTSGLVITDNDDLAITGFADQEAGNSPDPVSFDPTLDFNYTQIFKTSVSISGTLQNTFLRTGSKEQEALMKALKFHMGDIERSMFFGQRHIENAATSTPTRYTGGLMNTITNVLDVASAFATNNVMTEKEFDRTLVESIFGFGNPEKVAFCGPRAVSNLMEIGKNRWQPTQVDNAYGVSFTRYTTFAGDLLVYMHPMFRQIPSLQQSMVILDMPNIKYRYMKSRDTQLKRDVQADDFDGSKHFYMTECGFEMTQSKPHWIINNWAAVSA